MVAVMGFITIIHPKQWLMPWAHRGLLSGHETPDPPFCLFETWEGGSLGGGKNDATPVFGSFLVPTNALNIFHFLSAFVKQL